MKRYVGRALTDALAALDVVPKNCTEVELLIAQDSVVRLRFTVLVEANDLLALAAAFQQAVQAQEPPA